MLLTHRHRDKFEYDEDKIYTQGNKDKPSGLWLSDESEKDSWAHYQERVQKEQYGSFVKFHKNNFEVKLEDILQITNPIEMEMFVGVYGTPENGGRISPTLIHTKAVVEKINWTQVAYEYKGILIVPHQKILARKPSFRWYKNWDCNSACIWDLRCVQPISG